MDSRQLRFFRAILDAGSLGKAAEQLNMSQPALTKNLRRLEDELGLKLFDRNSRGVRPTEYGRCLSAHARAVSVDLEQALHEINALKSGTRGAVVIGAPPLLASQMLVMPIIQLNKEFPGVQVRVLTQSRDFISGLLNGDYHFLINLLRGKRPPDIRQELLFDDRLVLIARRDHPLRRMAVSSVRDLQPFSWVLPDRDNPHWGNIELFFESEAMPVPQSAVATNSVSVIRSVVLNSDYIGIVAATALPQSDFTRNGELIVINTNSVTMRRPIGIMWRNNQVMPQAVQRFFSIIEASARDFPRVNSMRRGLINLRSVRK
jgi:DNA-binding transcriptional LysR family regulator